VAEPRVDARDYPWHDARRGYLAESVLIVGTNCLSPRSRAYVRAYVRSIARTAMTPRLRFSPQRNSTKNIPRKSERRWGHTGLYMPENACETVDIPLPFAGAGRLRSSAIYFPDTLADNDAGSPSSSSRDPKIASSERDGRVLGARQGAS